MAGAVFGALLALHGYETMAGVIFGAAMPL